jgi:alanyl-tRNA synthetase
VKTANQIRTEFLEFFQEKGHSIVPSDSIVPGNDPTLMFTNAGMNQFKDVFLGEGARSYVRAADTQKCLRVSGKHNDLEEVGYDTYHHTFFEMLGNWSFGDYFKKEAIAWAWELLVDRWGLDPGRLYATVHEGDEKLGLKADEEAASFWKSETTINHDHILHCWSKDNFWMMGDTGPCGPCSEIHVDLRSDEERAKVPGISLVNQDDPRVMEIWNLVFIQYNAQVDGSLQALKSQHVDTGMGFERVVAVLQDKSSNYDTDLFLPLLDSVAKDAVFASLGSYQDALKLEGGEGEKVQIALRVIADHLRTICFAVADGVMPGNAGRGYVIRRILRRAVRYGYQTLGFRSPILFSKVGEIVALMGEQFPELVKAQAYIERVIRAEEESFLETLGTGIEYFSAVAPVLEQLQSGAAESAVKSGIQKDRHVMDLLKKAYASTVSKEESVDDLILVGKTGLLPGEFAFLLHDTFGFPIDLTQLMARERGFSVDMARYSELMEQQKKKARAATSFKTTHGEGEDWINVSKGEDSVFTGYDSVSDGSVKIRQMREVQVTENTSQFEIILDRTPFYGESGGQVGDEGILVIGGQEIKVLDTQKRAGKIVHTVNRLPVDADSDVSASVDSLRRDRIVKHHTVTHLMHSALRERLGSHVGQKGSLVTPTHLRFDFSHFEKVGPEDLIAVENRVNEMIQKNIQKQEDRDIPIKQALDRGATALFGEKYGERVRVITFDPAYSIELCGGVHVASTGEIGLFRFTSEGSVASGVRRVEAVAGMDALGFIHAELAELGRVRDQFRTLQRPSDEEIADLIERSKSLEKEADALRLVALEQKAQAFVTSAITIGPLKLVVGRLDGADSGVLQEICSNMSATLGAGHVCVFGSADEAQEKVYLACSVSEDLVKGHGLQAGKLIGLIAKEVGGGGGGRPTLATAGGKLPGKLNEALAGVSSIIKALLT